MEQLLRTLARCGTADLATIIGTGTTDLLNAMSLGNLTSSGLSEIAVDLKTPEWFVTDKEWRKRVIEALSRSDAEKLAALLGLAASNDPWSAVLKCPFGSKHHNTAVLRRFFGIPPLQETQRTEPQPYQVVEPGYPLFLHQIEVQRKADSILSTNKPRVMLHMPTGSGKTRTAMNIIATYLRDRCSGDETVLWLAYSEELCSQAVDEFAKAWANIGNRPLKVCKNYREYRTPFAEASGFVVGSLSLLYNQSLGQQREFLEFARRVRMVVLDEAHQATAPTYNHLLNLLAPNKNTAVLGLTATPGRSWLDADEDIKLAQYFHGQKVGLSFHGYDSPVDYLQEHGFLAKINYQSLRYEVSDQLKLTERNIQALKNALDLPAEILQRLSEDSRRNALILHNVLSATKDPNNKVLVFACSVEHAVLLANILRIKGQSARAIIGDMPRHLREQSIRDFRDSDRLQVLTTYDVLTTGFDAPRANVAFVTRPTRSVVLYTQMVGRVARGPKQGGNESCDVYTVIDNIPGFRSLGEGFEYWEDIWTNPELRGLIHD